MAQLFSPRANHWARLLIIGTGVLLVSVIGLLLVLPHTPYSTGQYQTPEQPVPFSHQHHVGALGIDCQYCHTGVEKSDFAGLPDTATCMSCHSQIWTNAAMLAPVRASLRQDRPLRWRRVHDLPDFVYFNHEAHINNGVGCESCHGRVDRMPLVQQVKPLTMKWCLDCHRNPGPHLRETEQITAMGYDKRRITGAEHSQTLMEHYDIPTERMTECVTCHR